MIVLLNLTAPNKQSLEYKHSLNQSHGRASNSLTINKFIRVLGIKVTFSRFKLLSLNFTLIFELFI